MPSFGYYMLAQLMQKSAFNTVVTTNFDDLIFDALIFSNSKHRPLVISHQNSGHLIERSNIPMIVKMHGDANLQPFNTQESTTDPEKQILEGLKPVLNNTKIIFMGYSGGDKSVCTLLEQCKNIHGVYWLNQNGEPPQGEVKSWWEKSQHTKTLVTYKGFDELMMLALFNTGFNPSRICFSGSVVDSCVLKGCKLASPCILTIIGMSLLSIR
jgi:hypothetical protein